MTLVPEVEETVLEADAPSTNRKKRFSRSLKIGMTGVGIVIAVAIVSRFWLPGGVDSIRAANVQARLLPPFADMRYPLGTDHLGRDLVAQLMRATSNTLSIVAVGTAVAAVVGMAIGLIAAMFRGITEQILIRFTDVMYAIPAVLLALVLAAKLGASYGTATMALGLWFFPTIARVTRSAALSVRERAFISAARIYGRGSLFITWRHILPNIFSLVVVQITVVFALGILVEAGLAFLGVSTQPPEPSWGRMLEESQNHMGEAPWLAIMPGLAIVGTVLLFNMLGNGLRDRFDPRGTGEAAE